MEWVLMSIWVCIYVSTVPAACSLLGLGRSIKERSAKKRRSQKKGEDS